jgi:LmbE family N-acetylglucosaminyl deacetylase
MMAFRPELLVAHWFDDVHPDHEATFQMARTAFFRKIIREPQLDPASFPLFLLCDTYGSQGFRGPFPPNLLVDVSDCWEDKLAAIRAHESQPTEFFSALVEKQCREHGRQKGVEYAEGFISINLFGLNRNLNLERLL